MRTFALDGARELSATVLPIVAIDSALLSAGTRRCQLPRGAHRDVRVRLLFRPFFIFIMMKFHRFNFRHRVPVLQVFGVGPETILPGLGLPHGEI